MSKLTRWECTNCSFAYPKWEGVCRNCKEIGTIEEREIQTEASTANLSEGALIKLQKSTTNNSPQTLTEIHSETQEGSERISTGIQEFDRVVGGGLMTGGATLLAGNPGSGKSSLLGAVAQNLITSNPDKSYKVLYVSGEENATQIATRHRRINAVNDNIYILAEAHLDNVINHARKLKPSLIIVDSIQTMISPSTSSKPGSPSQLVEVSSEYINYGKQNNTPIILIGHVTKEGTIAGPRMVEHLVDTVLQLEVSEDSPLRLLRAVKNRFGATDEIGVFAHTEEGLTEITDPAGFFTSEHDKEASGYASTIIIEGIRAMPAEIQALSSPTTFPNPRKISHGLDQQRTLMIQAMMEKYTGARLNDTDVYLSTTGGIAIRDSSVDLAIAASLYSTLFNVPPPPNSIFIGELALTGEVRPARWADKRIREAERIGLENVYSHKNVKNLYALGTIFKSLKDAQEKHSEED